MAECLTAWKLGEDSATAEAGALLVAEAISNLDVCARFAVGYTKYLNSRRG
jgi:hypothetical protein